MARARRLAVALGCALVALTCVCAPGSAARADETIELRLDDAPHAPHDAPDVIVHVPRHLRAERPLDLLIFLHGFSSCTRALIASAKTPCYRGGTPQRSYGLAEIHERAATNTILIVPQLAFMARDANAPRFSARGGFDAFVRDVRAQLAARIDPKLPIRSVTLLAHSAGYRAAAIILRDPERATPVHSVVLFDALYAEWDAFADWLRASEARRMISLYTHDRSTTRGNRELSARLAKDSAQKLSQERVDTPHRLVPERHLVEVLRELF